MTAMGRERLGRQSCRPSIYDCSRGGVREVSNLRQLLRYGEWESCCRRQSGRVRSGGEHAEEKATPCSRD